MAKAAVTFWPNHTVSMPTHDGWNRSTTARTWSRIFSRRSASPMPWGVDTQP